MERKQYLISFLVSRVLLLLVCSLLLCNLVSCKSKKTSFAGLLAKIDQNQNKISISVFENAAKQASGSIEQLRIMKRAKTYGPEVYARVAQIIVHNNPNLTESVALSVLDAFLTAGMYKDAIPLFYTSLDYKARAKELTELLVRAFRSDIRLEVTTDFLIGCFEVSADYRFMEAAAVFAMYKNDIGLARSLLLDLSAQQTEYYNNCNISLLWDTGLYELISKYPDRLEDPLFTAVKADSDFLLGNMFSAFYNYKYIIEQYPQWSWKPYAAIARPAESNKLFKNNYQQYKLSEYYYSLMLDRFPDDVQAVLEYVNFLFFEDNLLEAQKYMQNIKGEAAAVLAIRLLPIQKKLSKAMELASEYPDSALALDSALETFVDLYAWNNFSDLWKQVQTKGIAVRHALFWNLVSNILNGDIEKAIDQLPLAFVDFRLDNEYIFSYNEGLLLLFQKKYKDAYDSFIRATNFSVNPIDKARAMVLAGDSSWLAGKENLTIQAYEEARNIDPGNIDTRSRLERVKHYLWN